MASNVVMAAVCAVGLFDLWDRPGMNLADDRDDPSLTFMLLVLSLGGEAGCHSSDKARGAHLCEANIAIATCLNKCCNSSLLASQDTTPLFGDAMCNAFPWTSRG